MNYLAGVILPLFFVLLLITPYLWAVNKELRIEIAQLKQGIEMRKQEIYHAGYANGAKYASAANARIEKYKCINGNIGLSITIEATRQEVERA